MEENYINCLEEIQIECAIKLAQGFSFNDIKQTVGITRAQLTLWLQDQEFIEVLQSHYRETELIFAARIDKAVLQAIGKIQHSLQADDDLDIDTAKLCLDTIKIWQNYKMEKGHKKDTKDMVSNIDITSDHIEDLRKAILGVA